MDKLFNSQGNVIELYNFELVNWYGELTVYFNEKNNFNEGDLETLFNDLDLYIDTYNSLSFDIRTTPLNICILNILFSKILKYNIYDIKISWENLTNFNFTGEITGLKHLELYLSNPREDDVLRLINMLNPNINVNIRCYENGPLNEKNMFSYSRLMRELQNKIIHIFKDKNIPFKAYC